MTLALTAGLVARAVDGRLVSGDADTPIDSVSIDSRTVKPGDLFFAIRGERFDGHDFVEGALAAGAVGVVVSHGSRLATLRGRAAGAGRTEVAGAGNAASATEVVAIEVDDTTRALQALARDVRRQSGARVIAITGSAGKTTTKEVTAELLALRYRTFRNRGNLNNHIGLPLSLLELRTRPEMAVVELGMSAPGEIRTLVGIAEPDVRVWTNVGEAHLESFPSVDGIADAKAEILEDADREDCLVLNANDPRVVARTRAFPGRVWTFGIDAPADVWATQVRELGLEGVRATVRVSPGLMAWAGRAAGQTPHPPAPLSPGTSGERGESGAATLGNAVGTDETSVAPVSPDTTAANPASADARAVGPAAADAAGADAASAGEARAGSASGDALRMGPASGRASRARPGPEEATDTGVLSLDASGAGVVEMGTPLLGRANLANVLAGMAVALDAGVPLGALVTRAATLAPAAHRGEVRRLESGITVLDDAYNANPLAVTRALEIIAAEPTARRRVAVLGEMLELGPESVRLHQSCGRAAVRARVDVLITVGGEPARALGEAAVDAGLARGAVTHVADSAAAADLVATLVQPGDLVLVKGSRGVRLERVVERLHGAHR